MLVPCIMRIYEASWMTKQSQEVLDDYANIESALQLEVAKIKYNAFCALERLSDPAVGM